MWREDSRDLTPVADPAEALIGTRVGTLTLRVRLGEDLRSRNATLREAIDMAHSTDRKKEQKKKPQKTAKEKKQEKREKKK